VTVLEESAAGLAALLAGAVLAAGSSALTGPVTDATAFCFTWSETGAPYADAPVYLYAVDAAGRPLSRLRPGRTGSSGCGSFSSPPPDVRVRVFAAVSEDGRSWSGRTPVWAVAGSGPTDLARGLVHPLP